MNPKYKKKYYSSGYKKKAAAKRAAKAAPTVNAAAVKAIVKYEMNKTMETKRTDYYLEPLPINCLYHNVWSNIDNNCLYNQQGINDTEAVAGTNRIGDSIYCKSIHFCCLFNKFSDRCNMVLRILILKVKSGMTVLNPTAHPQLNHTIISPVSLENANIISVAYDRSFVLNNNQFIYNATGAVTRDTKFLWRHTLKVEQKIKYQDAATDPAHWTYRVYFTMYDTQNSLTTDNVGRYSYRRSCYFVDA